MGIIYQARNISNGMLYIGKTVTTLRIRATKHCNDALAHRDNFYFHSAIRKYGTKSFVWEKLIEVDDSELSAWEIYYIDLARDQGYQLYNLTDGGEGIAGYKHTDESKQRIGEANKGYKHTEYAKERMKITNKGKSTAKAIQRMQETNSKVYYMRSPEGNVVRIENMAAFCKANNLNQGHMIDVCNGKRRSSHGWTKLE